MLLQTIFVSLAMEDFQLMLLDLFQAQLTHRHQGIQVEVNAKEIGNLVN
jgi:hypothetical protein